MAFKDDIIFPTDRKFRVLRVKHILERETDANHSRIPIGTQRRKQTEKEIHE